jgi:putative membrane protein
VYVGRSYGVAAFLDWTRRRIYWLVVLASVPVVLYEVLGMKWLALPWSAVALLGTAAAFLVGFKNLQTYNRAWEARQIWGDIVAASRGWGALGKDFVTDVPKTREIVDRHLAWLTALRYQMREPRRWETLNDAHSAEWARRYVIPEQEVPLEVELAKYLSRGELPRVLAARNKPAQIAALQSAVVKDLYTRQTIPVLLFVHLQREIKELFVLQARSERIKDFPFPRQFATVCTLFVKLFCLSLPFGLLREFESGPTIWLAVPLSVVISWVYASLDQVGESTENPFEGGANDVPISQLSRAAEIDMLEMIGEAALPLPLEPLNDVML